MKHTALIVDSEPLVRSFVAYLLRYMNWEVLTAETLEQAWDLYCEYEDSVVYVFSDCHLPRGRGLDLYRKIREKSAAITVVLSSGYPDVVLPEVEADPNAFFLPKPFSPESLMGTLRRMKLPVSMVFKMEKQANAA